MNVYVECTWSWSRKHDKDHSRVTPFDNAQCNDKQPMHWIYMMILHKALVGHVIIIEDLLFWGFWNQKLQMWSFMQNKIIANFIIPYRTIQQHRLRSCTHNPQGFKIERQTTTNWKSERELSCKVGTRMKISRATIHHFNKEELNIPTNIEESKKYFCSFYPI
jgi:hypothetical protein